MAATPSGLEGSVRVYTTVGGGTPGAGAVIIETDNVSRYDTFVFLFSAGSFTVEGSIDGSTWSTALQLEDRGATTLTMVTTGVAGTKYAMRTKIPYLRVKQSGGTALVGKMLAGTLLGT